MKSCGSDQTDIARNITINENGLELSTKDIRNNSRNSYSTKSDSDEYPFNAITYGESENLLGLPYNDHNYAMSEEKVEKIKLESKNSSHLSLLAKVALEKHEPNQYEDVKKNSFADESNNVKMIKLKEARMKNIQIGNKAILLAPSNKTTLFPRQKNNIYMKHQLSLNSPANLLKNDFIRCICGYTHDDGLLVKCDKCQMHQHIDCVSPNNDGFVPTPYYCDICQPRQMRYADAVCLQREKLAFINSGCTTSSLINGMNGNGLRFRTNAATFLPSRLFVTTSNQKKSPLQLRIGTATSATGQMKGPGQMNLQSSQNLITLSNTQTSNELNVNNSTGFHNPLITNYVNKQNYFSTEFINNQSSTVNFKSKRKQEFIYPSSKITPDSSVPKESSSSNLVQVMLKNGNYYINSDRNGSVDENVPPLTPTGANNNTMAMSNNGAFNSIGGFCEENFEVLTKSRISDRLRDHLMSPKSKLSNFSILQYYYSQVNSSQKNHSQQSLQKLNGIPSYQLVLLEFNQKCVLSNKFIESHEPILEVKGVIRLAEEYTSCYDYRKHFEPYVLFYKKFHKTQLVIDSREVGNCARFLRRSCSPNCEIKHVIHEDAQTNELSVRFLLISTKPIPSKVELTIPFDFDPTQCRYNVKCACESPNCKNLSINKPSARALKDSDEEDSVNGAPNENMLQNYKMREKTIKGKPGRKPLGIANKSRAVINRTKKSIRKPRLETTSTASSKLIALASASIKGLAKAKKTFSLRKSLIRRANATLSIAATKRKLSQTKKSLLTPNETGPNTTALQPLRRKNSSINLNSRPPIKRSRQHSASNAKQPNRGSLTKNLNSGATRSRSSIKRVNYNVDNSSSQYDEDESSAEEFEILEKKEDSSYEMIRPQSNPDNTPLGHQEDEDVKYSDFAIDSPTKMMNKNNNSNNNNNNNNEGKDVKHAFLDDTFNRRSSGDRKRSGKQHSNARLNSSNENKSKGQSKYGSNNRSQTMEKSREDKWMDEVMRRIERMEKKDRRRKNSGQNSKSLNEDCKSPDHGDEMIKSIMNSDSIKGGQTLSGYQSPSLEGKTDDCGLIVYKALEKDPMAKFSRSRSNKSEENVPHRGNYLATMALIADNEFIDNNQSLYQTKMNSTTTESQPTKKRWLTQARLEKEEEISCDEHFGLYQSTPKVERGRAERKQDEDDASVASGNSQMDKLLALSMTASEILLNKSSESSPIPTRTVVHPLKKRVVPQISSSNTEEETKEEVEEEKVNKEDEAKNDDYSDLHLLSFALNENLEKDQVKKEEEDQNGPMKNETQSEDEKVKEEVDDLKKDDTSLNSSVQQAKKTKVSLSEYRRRKGIPINSENVKKPCPDLSRTGDKEDEEKMPLDEINLEATHTDQSYLESRISELLSNVNNTPSLAQSISSLRNKMPSDLSTKKPLSPPPPPPMNMSSQSSLIDYTGSESGLGKNNINNNIESPNVNFLLKRDIEILAWQENHLNKATRKMSQNLTRQFGLSHTSSPNQSTSPKAQYNKRPPISNASSNGDEKDKEFSR